MDYLTRLHHLLSFFAPALALAFWLVLWGRFIGPKQPPALAWYTQAAINTVAGCAVLLAGLYVFGQDGKMATYGALVLVMALVQWALLRRG